MNVNYRHGPVSGHDVGAAHISWDKKGSPGASYVQSNWAPVQGGRDASGYATLEFRVSPDCLGYSCSTQDPHNANGQGRDFSIALVDSQGKISRSVSLAHYLSMERVGTLNKPFPPYHVTLPSVRIPLFDFGTFARQRLRGVRFTFDRTTSGAVQIANLRLSARPNPVSPVPGPAKPLSVVEQTLVALARQQAADSNLAATRVPPPVLPAYGNDVVAIRRVAAPRPKVAASAVSGKAPDTGDLVEIQLHSLTAIPVTDSLLTLDVGPAAFEVSRFVNGSTKDVVFTLAKADFDKLKDRSPMALIAGRDQRSFGVLSKTMLK